MRLPGREQQQQHKELLMSYFSPGAPQAVQEGSGSGDGDALSLWGLLGVRLREGGLGEPKACGTTACVCPKTQAGTTLGGRWVCPRARLHGSPHGWWGLAAL